jgi:short-subunit dehydrogenase
VADFSLSHRNPDDFYTNLFTQLSRYEISVLVNNVGVVRKLGMDEHSDQDIEHMLGINVYAQTMLMHHFLPKFEDRFSETGKRSLVVNISSAGGEVAVPAIPVYSATKRYNSFLSQAAEACHRSAVTMTSVSPLGVRTNLAFSTGLKGGPLLLSPDRLARSVFES